MDVNNPLIKWYIHRFHRLVQRECCASVIQTTTLVYHVLIKHRCDLVRLTIVHRPHRLNHRAEPKELHRRRKMDRLVRILFVSNCRMTRRVIHKFGILQIACDDPLDCKVHIMQSEHRLKRLWIWDIMTCKVDPFVLAELFNETRKVGILSIYTRECSSMRWAILFSSVATERSALPSAAVA